MEDVKDDYIVLEDKNGVKVIIDKKEAQKLLKKLKRYAYLHKNISLHIDEDVAKGMAKSCFGIITPSTIAYEAIYMDLKFIAIQVAKNQDNLVKYLKKKRYKIFQKRELWKIN